VGRDAAKPLVELLVELYRALYGASCRAFAEL